MCIAAAQDMQELLAENQRLVSEINGLHSGQGASRAPPALVKPVSEAMAQLMGVQYEDLGIFPAGFGDNWANNLSRHLPVRNEADGLGAEPRSPLHDTFAPNELQSPSPYESTLSSNRRLSPAIFCGGMAQQGPLLESWYEGSTLEHGVQDIWGLGQPLDRQSSVTLSTDAELPQLNDASIDGQALGELPALTTEPPMNSSISTLSTTQIRASEWTQQGNASHLSYSSHPELGDLTIPSYYAQPQFI